jgi:hypothetical protein
MRLKTQRKVIYTTMALTVLALVGGYAAAQLTSSVTSGNQNGFTFSAPANTMYSGTTPSASLVYTQVPGGQSCTSTGGTVNAASAATTANAYLTGQATCQTSASDFFEEYTFASGTVSTATPSDTFTISCTGFADESVTIAYSGLTSGTSTVTTSIYYELGGSAVSVACTIVVNGS